MLFPGESQNASSVSASSPPSLCTNLESSPLITRHEKEEDKNSKLKAGTAVFVNEEGQEGEAVWPKGEDQAGLGDSDPKAEPDRPTGGSFSSPSHPFGHIDSVVEKHLGHFSAEMQLVLQQESISTKFPASAPLPRESTAIACSLPYRPISHFSQYVSFYNPCPPVQDYVSSLQDNIESMLTEMVDNWPRRKPASGPRNGDAALASKVSAFVSSIRASKEDSSDGELTDVCQNPVSSLAGEAWQQRTFEALPKHGSPTGPRAASSASSSINTADTAVFEHANCEADFSCASDPSTEASLPAEPASSQSPAHTRLGSPPPATALSSLIKQLQPEVFDNLMDIIKDVRRNSVQFYLHSSEPGDQVYEDIKVCARQHEAFWLN